MKNDRLNIGDTPANKYKAGTTCAWVYQKLNKLPLNKVMPIERLLNKYGEGVYLKTVRSTIVKVCKDQGWKYEFNLNPDAGRIYVKMIRR